MKLVNNTDSWALTQTYLKSEFHRYGAHEFALLTSSQVDSNKQLAQNYCDPTNLPVPRLYLSILFTTWLPECLIISFQCLKFLSGSLLPTYRIKSYPLGTANNTFHPSLSALPTSPARHLKAQSHQLLPSANIDIVPQILYAILLLLTMFSSALAHRTDEYQFIVSSRITSTKPSLVPQLHLPIQSQQAICTCVSLQHPVHMYFWCIHQSSFIRF